LQVINQVSADEISSVMSAIPSGRTRWIWQTFPDGAGPSIILAVFTFPLGPANDSADCLQTARSPSVPPQMGAS
jgi:hypothetical protein